MHHQATKLTICGFDYRVIYATPDEVPELAANEGWCREESNTIYVRANMPHSRMVDCLVHEVLHAFLEASGVGHFLQDNHDGDEASYDRFEETLIRLLTPSIRRLVSENGSALIDVPVAVSAQLTRDSGKNKRTKKTRRR